MSKFLNVYIILSFVIQLWDLKTEPNCFFDLLGVRCS